MKGKYIFTLIAIICIICSNIGDTSAMISSNPNRNHPSVPHKTSTTHPTTTTQKTYFSPRANTDETTETTTVSPDPSFFETIQNLLQFLAGNDSILDNVGLLTQSIIELLFRFVDHIRYKFTWITNEIEYVQCLSNSLLRSNFFGRHMSILLRIFNESLKFARNVFGDALNETDPVPDQILDDHDAQENRNLIKQIASREAATLMNQNKFMKCTSTYFTSIFSRVLNLLYGPSIDASTRRKRKPL